LLLTYFENVKKMKNLRTSIIACAMALCLFPNLQAQTNAKSSSNIKLGGMNEMPSTLRTSMNVTIGKQTQSIALALVDDGCVILSPNQAFQVVEKTNTMTEISRAEFGDRVNAGKQSQGVNFGDRVNAGRQKSGVVSGAAGLLGGAMPGASIVSAAVSSVSNLANSGGASSAAYAATGKMAWTIKDDATTFELPQNLSDGDYELSFIILKDTLKKQVRLGFSVTNGVLKTKHDTVKNSISNVR
jgi:hypothetical protein